MEGMNDIVGLVFEGRDLVFIGRIALAGFLSFLIGWEREARGSHAGDRTHALVAIATAAFTSIGVERFAEDAGGIMIGAGEYTMGIGLTALVLLVLIKEKVPVLSRFGRTSKQRQKGDSLS